MDELINKSLSNYFKALEHLGYIDYANVNKLLILLFINDFFLNEHKEYNTEEDIRIINKCLSCLYGSTCFIPESHSYIPKTVCSYTEP